MLSGAALPSIALLSKHFPRRAERRPWAPAVSRPLLHYEEVKVTKVTTMMKQL